MCELGTLIQNDVDVKIIVMENQRLGMVREFQDKLYGCRHIGTILENGNPDFVKLAESYGIEAARAENNAQAKELAQHMLQSNRAFILVCNVDPETPSI